MVDWYILGNAVLLELVMFFCCNCGGPCRKNSSEEIAYNQWFSDAMETERVKRSAYEFSSEDFNTALHFNAVDTDRNLKIELQEALEHLGKSENGIFQQIKNLFTPIWFSKMDTNQDGIISPNEFDRDLDENIMKQFHNMHYNFM